MIFEDPDHGRQQKAGPTNYHARGSRRTKLDADHLGLVGRRSAINRTAKTTANQRHRVPRCFAQAHQELILFTLPRPPKWCFLPGHQLDESTIKIIPSLSGEEPINVRGFKIRDGTPMLFSKNDLSILWNETRFLIYIRDKARTPTPTTANTYAQKLVPFLELIRGNDIDIASLTFNEITAYRDALVNKGLKHSTINQSMAVVKSYLDFLVSIRVIARNPLVANISLSENEIPIRAIPFHEVKATLSFLSPCYALMTRLALCTGLRSEEITNLKLSGLSASSTNAAFVELRVRRKGRRETSNVTCPREMNEELVRWAYVSGRPEIIKKAKRKSPSWKEPDSVFISQHGLKFAKNRISKEFTSAAKRAGVYEPWKTFHGLRHTFGITMLTQLLAADKKQGNYDGTGMNALLLLRNIMGHRQLSSTLRYLTALRREEPAIRDSLTTIYDNLLP